MKPGEVLMLVLLVAMMLAGLAAFGLIVLTEIPEAS
jgi:hypothetical protein